MRAIAVLSAVIALAAACGKDDGPEARPAEPVASAFAEARVETARLQLLQVSQEAYPLWALGQPEKECPASLDDLVAYVAQRKLQDPWGHPLVMHCQDRPPGEDRFGVSSRGPDGQPDTADDLHSWDAATRRLGEPAGVRVEPTP